MEERRGVNCVAERDVRGTAVKSTSWSGVFGIAVLVRVVCLRFAGGAFDAVKVEVDGVVVFAADAFGSSFDCIRFR